MPFLRIKDIVQIDTYDFDISSLDELKQHRKHPHN